MKNLKNLLFLFVGFGFVSCSPKFYTPNTQNVPLISEKGEIDLTLAGNGNQVEIQGAYGITNSMAVKLNGGLFIPSDQTNGNGGSGKFIEIAGDYFKPITEHWIFEAYGLFGYGSFENHLPSTINNHPNTNGDISANILRFGVQPNFGYKTKHFSAAISSRIVNLSFNNIKGDLIYVGVNQPAYLKDNASNFMVEPALTIKAGFEKIKVQMQYGYSFNLSNNAFRQDNAYATIGLNFNFK